MHVAAKDKLQCEVFRVVQCCNHLLAMDIWLMWHVWDCDACVHVCGQKNVKRYRDDNP